MKIESKNHAIAHAQKYPAYNSASRIAVDESGNVIFGGSDEAILAMKGQVYMVKGEMPAKATAPASKDTK